MDETRTMIEASMCTALRDQDVSWPFSSDSAHDRPLRDCAAYHGVGPLLSRCFRGVPPVGLPTPRHLKDEAAIELMRKHELIRVLNALAESAVRPLLLKGTALAHTLYASPVLRPRADTDILIGVGDRNITAEALSELGYHQPNALGGELVTYQCGYVRRDSCGIEHVLDVHWRVSNTQMFSGALDHAELMLRSLPLPALGEHARMPALADSLLLACMHRVHHFHSAYRVEGVESLSGDRLIWLYDIHLLLEAMGDPELEAFARLAEEKGLRAICADGVQKTQQCFATRTPGYVLKRLQGAGHTEPSSAHLRKGGARHLLTELRSLPGWRERFGLLREHLLPSADYMLEKYATSNRAWLPMLYVRRGIHGALRRMLST
jgi:hypothetical protein